MTISRGKVFHFDFTGNTFTSPQNMIERFEEYIDWVEANPKIEKKYFGKGDMQSLEKMRMPSVEGFCRYLMTNSILLSRYKSKGGDWASAFHFVEDSLHAVALEGAAAGLIKEAIVTRKLGLSDRQEITGVERKVVILHAPQSQRSFPVQPEQNLIEEASFDEEITL